MTYKERVAALRRDELIHLALNLERLRVVGEILDGFTFLYQSDQDECKEIKERVKKFRDRLWLETLGKGVPSPQEKRQREPSPRSRKIQRTEDHNRDDRGSKAGEDLL